MNDNRLTVLSESEKADLARCESDVQKGLYMAWCGIREIHERKLYREYGTFADYCEKRWGFSDQRGRQLIRAADLIDEINTSGNDFELNERAARALLDVPAEQRIPVLLTAHSASGGKLDSGWIKDAATVQEQIEATGGFVDDGEGSMTAATAAVVEERHERVQRQREHIRENLERKNGTSNAPRFQGEFTVHSVNSKYPGMVVLFVQPDLWQALGQGQKGSYVMYLSGAEQTDEKQG